MIRCICDRCGNAADNIYYDKPEYAGNVLDGHIFTRHEYPNGQGYFILCNLCRGKESEFIENGPINKIPQMDETSLKSSLTNLVICVKRMIGDYKKIGIIRESLLMEDKQPEVRHFDMAIDHINDLIVSIGPVIER